MLNCLVSTSLRDGADSVEAIVQRMKEQSEAWDETVQPSVVAYGCLIKAWVRVGDAARAETALSELHREFISGKVSMKAQLRHFNQVAKAWSDSTDASSKEKVRSVLDIKKLVFPAAIHDDTVPRQIVKLF
jgi:hypothetical protein